MRRFNVSSEAIASVGYAPGMLEIEFTSHEIYQYSDVPRRVYRALMSADSIGHYFSSHIQGHYPYRRVAQY